MFRELGVGVEGLWSSGGLWSGLRGWGAWVRGWGSSRASSNATDYVKQLDVLRFRARMEQLVLLTLTWKMKYHDWISAITVLLCSKLLDSEKATNADRAPM